MQMPMKGETNMSDEIVTIENPRSANVSMYYKGFSIQITIRDPKQKAFPLLEKMTRIVDYALSKGMKPSWNKLTNDEIAKDSPEVPQRPLHEPTDGMDDALDQAEDLTVHTCLVHNVAMKKRTGQFGDFYSHGRKYPDGTFEWCTGKGWGRK